MASPIPEVEPVTTAVFPFSMTAHLSVRGLAREGFRRPNARPHQRSGYIFVCNDPASARRASSHAGAVSAGSMRSIVLRRPMSSKWASRKRRAARWPSLRNDRKNSKSTVELAARRRRPRSSMTIRCSRARCAPDEFERPQLRDQWRVEGDLVHAGHDLARGGRHLAALARIDLHDQDVGGCVRVQERQHHGIAAVAAVPIGHAVDLDRAEQERQAGRRHHDFGA